MTYFEQIRALAMSIPETLIDFTTPRDVARMPTQVSSNFITNKEQGDWAEELIFRAINELAKNYVVVRYGKSDDIIAGEDGFEQFFEEFQNELDTIGKRPDLLLFRKQDYNPQWGKDISHVPHAEIDDYVRKAVAGIEVRSSAFLINRYEEAMRRHVESQAEIVMATKKQLLDQYGDLLKEEARLPYLNTLESINRQNLSVIDFKAPGWRASQRLKEASELFKRLKDALKEIRKRDYLSITPKAEDIKVVYKWIETYNVPHFYFQVFFDKIYGIAFQDILSILGNPANEGRTFSVESDPKNQNKTTFKIRSNAGAEVASRVDEPHHHSERKEMCRGRLLFYVAFDGGAACIDTAALRTLLHIDNEL